MTEFYYVTLIDAPREKVWRALTTAEFTQQYWHNTQIQSDWIEGGQVKFLVDGRVSCEGELFICSPYEELSYGWNFSQNPACTDEQPSRVTFTLLDVEGATKLTVRHDQFNNEDSPTYQMVSAGWPYVLAGLKSLCEKGITRDFSQLYV